MRLEAVRFGLWEALRRLPGLLSMALCRHEMVKAVDGRRLRVVCLRCGFKSAGVECRRV